MKETTYLFVDFFSFFYTRNVGTSPSPKPSSPGLDSGVEWRGEEI